MKGLNRTSLKSNGAIYALRWWLLYVASGKDVAGIEYKSMSEEKLMKAESKSNKMKSA